MDRIQKIMNNSTYVNSMSYIKEAEKDRQFCLHGLEHSLDVARICHIINLEEALGFNKEVIYAMALLHDIGRSVEYKAKLSHHKAGSDIAVAILNDAGFDEEETLLICDAIASHKHVEASMKDLKYLLYKADKLSRNCFDCSMYAECYWDENLKNKEITY